MSPSCIACEMISAKLSNLLWGSSIMASCFLCFTVRALEDFREAIIERERSTPNAPKAPTGRPMLLANAGIEVSPVISDDVIRPASTIPMILLNRFFFLPAVCGPQFHQEKMSRFQLIFLIDMFVVLMVLKGLNLDTFWYHCHIYSLFI